MKFIIELMYQVDSQETYMFITSYCGGPDEKPIEIISRKLLGSYKNKEMAHLYAIDLKKMLESSDSIKNDAIILETKDNPNYYVEDDEEPPYLAKVLFGIE